MIIKTKKGDIGVDYAWSHPSLATLQAQGYTFAIRYIGGSTGKRLTIPERDALWAHGLGIVLVWETSATRPLAGQYGGAIDGKEARIQARALGYPESMPIIIANDTDVYSGNIGAVRAYNAAFAREAGLFGIYGDTDAFSTMVGFSTINWHANAWKNQAKMDAHSGPMNGPDGYVIHIFQQKQQGIFDPNVCNLPFPIWVQDQKVEQLMTNSTAVLVTVTGYHNVFLVGAGAALHVTTELVKHWTSKGVPVVEVAPHDQFFKSLETQCGKFEWVKK